MHLKYQALTSKGCHWHPPPVEFFNFLRLSLTFGKSRSKKPAPNHFFYFCAPCQVCIGDWRWSVLKPQEHHRCTSNNLYGRDYFSARTARIRIYAHPLESGGYSRWAYPRFRIYPRSIYENRGLVQRPMVPMRRPNTCTADTWNLVVGTSAMAKTLGKVACAFVKCTILTICRSNSDICRRLSANMQRCVLHRRRGVSLSCPARGDWYVNHAINLSHIEARKFARWLFDADEWAAAIELIEHLL